MKNRLRGSLMLLVLLLQGCIPQTLAEASEWPDMLTPIYYPASADDAL
jgi:hypothetical protein